MCKVSPFAEVVPLLPTPLPAPLDPDLWFTNDVDTLALVVQVGEASAEFDLILPTSCTLLLVGPNPHLMVHLITLFLDVGDLMLDDPDQLTTILLDMGLLAQLQLLMLTHVDDGESDVGWRFGVTTEDTHLSHQLVRVRQVGAGSC